MSDNCTITIDNHDDWQEWYDSDGANQGFPEPEKPRLCRGNVFL